MKKTKTRVACSVFLVLLLSISATAFLVPLSNAHTPAWTIPTYAYVSASPPNIGLGDYTVIVMWLDKYPPTAGGAGGDRWQGFQLDITKPDGTKETVGPYTSSTIGSNFVVYTPTMAGDYSIVFSWPGQTLTNGTGVPNNAGVPYVGDYFQPSRSAPAILHVGQQRMPTWQEPSAPVSDYWTRPIYSANRGWSSLASNWLKGSWLVDNFQRAGQAPNSAHILWAKPIIAGGIPDAQWSGNVYDTDDYESPWTSPIIMNGVMYYNTGIYPKYGYYALNLQTGEQLWYKNGTDNGLGNTVVMSNLGGGGGTGPPTSQTFPLLSFGQLYHYYSLNGQGTLTYLWITSGSTWHMMDANTGNWILSIKNVPGGTSVTDQDGDLLRYSYNSKTGNLLCWNSSQSIPPAGPTGTSQLQWKPPTGLTIDAVNDTTWTKYPTGGQERTPWYPDDVRPRSGYTMNITIPKNLPGSISVLQDESRVPKVIFGTDFSTSSRFGSFQSTFSAWAIQIDEHVTAYNPQPDKPFTQNNNLGYGATLLWYKNYTYPLGGNVTFNLGSTSYVDGVWTIQSKETMQTWGYSLTNGNPLWGPTAPQAAFDMYGMSSNVAYGKIFSCGYAGILYAYDIKTGNLLWTYNATGIGYESPYGDYPLSIGAIADGKVFLYSTEHSPTIPLWRGSYLRAVDVNTGQEVWKLLDFNMGMGVADGYIVTGNKYDNRMYVIGRGPSATTVSASPKVVERGSPVLIEGTVTDQSPGAKGSPAISDADQQAWMEYLYEQQIMPTNVNGVQLTLTAVDSSGNTQTIATVTSDKDGVFHKMWTPSTEGEYIIVATFAGSASYGSSHAATSLGVGAAPTATPQPTAAPTPVAGAEVVPLGTFYAFAAVLIILMIVVIAVVILRKK